MPNERLLWTELWNTTRSLLRRPGLTLGVLLSLSIGAGVTATVVSVVESALLEPVPGLHDAGRVMIVAGSKNESGVPNAYLSYLDFRDIASQATAFVRIAAFYHFDVNMTHVGSVEDIRAAAISMDYFAVLDSTPSLGSLSWGDDEQRPVAVISRGLWRRQFAGAPLAEIPQIVLNGVSFKVVGVAPRGFKGVVRVDPVEVWVPLRTYQFLASGPLATLTGGFDRNQEWLQLVGRLKAGTTPMMARRELSAISHRLALAHPDTNSSETLVVVTAQQFSFGPEGPERVRRYLLILIMISFLTLVICCANVANLLATRSLERQEEFRIRLCLGAARKHLVRLHLWEGVAMALLGGAGGFALAAVALPLLETFQSPVNVVVGSRPSLWVVAAAFVASFLVALFATLLPIGGLGKTGSLARFGGRRSSRGWLRRIGGADVLVVVQMAVALIVLVGGGLFLRSLQELTSVDTGFDSEELLVFDLDLSFLNLPPADVGEFYESILQKIRRLSTVEGASIVGGIPLLGGSLGVQLSVDVEGVGPTAPGPGVTYALVGPDYFNTVGTNIRKGRAFSAQDTAGTTLVAIVDETLVQQYGFLGDPLRGSLRLAQGEGPFQVIGVAEGVTPTDPRESRTPVLYLAYPQRESSLVGQLMGASMSVVVRANGDPRKLAAQIRGMVQGADTRLPPVRIATLDSKLAQLAGTERQISGLLSGLGGVGLALSLVGLYALMTRALARRRREVAIRIAVGASPARVLRQILGRSLALSLAAVTLGLPSAWLLGTAATGYLYGVSAADPLTYVTLALGLTSFALLVAAIPGWRAARMVASDVLRSV
jgi:predicted permease